PEATPTPTPVPTFDVPATPVATPMPTAAPVVQASPSLPRTMRPAPVVRIRGRLTANGARVTLLTVRAPKGVRVTIRCQGRSCPRARWSRVIGARGMMRVRAFERTLAAGTRLVISVTRAGYIGKRTVIVIRRGLAPRRADGCLAANSN